MPIRLIYPWRGLTSRLFIIFIFPLTVSLLLVTFGGLRLHQMAMRNLVGGRDERAVRAAAETLEERFDQRQQAIRSIALLHSELGHLPEQSITSDLYSKFDIGVAHVNSSGVIEEYVGNSQFWEELGRSQIPGQLSTGSGNVESTLFLVEEFESTGTVLLVNRALHDGTGHVTGGFSPAALIDGALSQVFAPAMQGLAYVIDENRQIIYYTGQDSNLLEQDLKNHPGVEEALNGISGATFMDAPQGEHVVAYSPVSPMNWGLVIEEPWEIVATPLLRITEYAPLVLFPVIVFAVATLWYVSSQIVQPLLKLEKQASELAWGNFEAIESSVGGVEEIKHLQDTLIHLAHRIRSAQQALRGYISAITRGQEEERRRLARELHDDTLQSIIALNQRVQFARIELNPSRADESLAEIQELAENSIRELRRFTRALRPIYLEDLGLVPALDMLVRENSSLSGIEMHFECTGVERRLSPEVELVVYRITQEALSNTAKHSYASEAKVTLSYLPDQLLLTIQDNGKGFEVPESPAEFAPGDHFGLLGMYERAELILASLSITSRPAHGTRVNVTVPYQEN